MKSILLFMLWLAAPAFAAEGVEVSAAVDRQQVGVGDVINFTIGIGSRESVNIEEPRLPEMDGFQVMNKAISDSMKSGFENGRFFTTRVLSYSYMLVVEKPGNLTIPSVNVTVDGQSYATEPIQVSVSNQRSVQPRAQKRGGGRGRMPDPFDLLEEEEELFRQMLQRNFPGGNLPVAPSGPPVNPNEAFFIRAAVDKEEAYAGEQITVAFYLYTRGDIRDIDTLKYPDLKGFWKEEIEMATRLNFEQEVIEGVPYRRALLVSYALFPIKAGKAVIDPYKAKCTVITPTNFGFGRPYQFTKASRPIQINVKEIPAAGRPANFTGAVGNFRLTSAFEPPTGAVNQPVTLRLRFEGQGNAKLIELPDLGLPPSFELYDQKSQANFAKDGTSYKEFEVLIIPREPGVFQIPATEVAVFDPKSGKFTNIASQPLSLTVTGTATAAPAMAGGPAQPSAPSGPRLPTIATEMGSAPMGNEAMVGITVGAYFALFGFLGLTAWRNVRRRPRKASLNMVLKNRTRRMRELAAQNQVRGVGVEVTNAAYHVLGRLSDQGGANLELARLLEKTPPSLREELAEPIRKLLAQSEALSFAPEALVGELSSPEKLKALIDECERVLSRAIELSEI